MNMQQIMQQARKMQQEISKKQSEIEAMEFVGKSEWVEMTFNGKKELKSFKLLKSDGVSSDEVEVLEDMISIALKDAFKKIDDETEAKMSKYTNMANGLF